MIFMYNRYSEFHCSKLCMTTKLYKATKGIVPSKQTNYFWILLLIIHLMLANIRTIKSLWSLNWKCRSGEEGIVEKSFHTIFHWIEWWIKKNLFIWSSSCKHRFQNTQVEKFCTWLQTRHQKIRRHTS